MLNDMEAALLRARGYEPPAYVWISDRDVVARASKRVGDRVERAEALGRNEDDALRKLVAVLVRP